MGFVDGEAWHATFTWDGTAPWTVKVTTPAGEAMIDLSVLEKAWWEAFTDDVLEVRAGRLSATMDVAVAAQFVDEAHKRSVEAEQAWSRL